MARVMGDGNGGNVGRYPDRWAQEKSTQSRVIRVDCSLSVIADALLLAQTLEQQRRPVMSLSHVGYRQNPTRVFLDIPNWKRALVLADVNLHRLSNRAHVRHALDHVRALTRTSERWQQDCDQNGNNPDHHEQLNQRKRRGRFTRGREPITWRTILCM